MQYAKHAQLRIACNIIFGNQRSAVFVSGCITVQPHLSAAGPNDRSNHKPANYPHKLPKTADPLARRRAASGGSNCTRASRRLPVRSCHCVLVAAAAAPLPGGRHGRRLLPLRESALGGPVPLVSQNSKQVTGIIRV